LESIAEMLHPDVFAGVTPMGGAIRLSADQLKAPCLDARKSPSP
jgi:hypothetical protein